MKNCKTGETMEMSMEELMDAMREGKVTVQQQVHHADGTVTSSTIYGNDTGDGIDRSLNILGTMQDVFSPAIRKAQSIREAEENAEHKRIIFNDRTISRLVQWSDRYAGQTAGFVLTVLQFLI